MSYFPSWLVECFICYKAPQTLKLPYKLHNVPMKIKERKYCRLNSHCSAARAFLFLQSCCKCWLPFIPTWLTCWHCKNALMWFRHKSESGHSSAVQCSLWTESYSTGLQHVGSVRTLSTRRVGLHLCVALAVARIGCCVWSGPGAAPLHVPRSSAPWLGDGKTVQQHMSVPTTAP